MPESSPAISWQDPAIIERFLRSVRDTIPLGIEQVDMAVQLVNVARESRVERFLAIGCEQGVLSGALLGFGLNSWLVDAVIGLSVAWKAFDNLGGFESGAGRRPDPKLMVLLFGLVHGLGLATRLEALKLRREGLVVNLVSFNVGVEIGQVVALAMVLGSIAALRRTALFARTAVSLNWAIMAAGFVLTGTQLAGYAFAEGM